MKDIRVLETDPWLTCNFAAALISSYPSPYYSSVDPDHVPSHGGTNWVLFLLYSFHPRLLVTKIRIGTYICNYANMLSETCKGSF